MIKQSMIDCHNRLREKVSTSQWEMVLRLQTLLADWEQPAPFLAQSPLFLKEEEILRKQYGNETLSNINKLLVVSLALALPEKLAERHLTEAVLGLYPAAMARLEESISSWDCRSRFYGYPDESFIKDLRFATGQTIPCGTMILDLRSIINWRVGPRLIMRNHPKAIFHFLNYYRQVPWFRSHLEMRYPDAFNRAGMELFYRRAAGLLEQQPEVKGLVSSSWFYDSRLEAVSPHLAYLWDVPLSHGAHILRGPSSQFDIAMATAKSRTRARLYHDGNYLPVCCLLIWPRPALLRWAAGHGGTL